MNELEDFRHVVPLTGDIATDAPAFLRACDQEKTARHCGDVAAEARRLAALFGADPVAAEQAGWLHDISVVIPNERRIEVARAWDVAVLDEEAVFPMIIHQKLSVVMARDVFGVRDQAILSAIGCHTTLKRDASAIDTVVFTADKLKWDQTGVAPFHAAMHAALERSLDDAAWVYLAFIWQHRANLRVVHPWLRDAYEQRAPVHLARDANTV